jgi:outer membrane receptor protein involved in Fe transport
VRLVSKGGPDKPIDFTLGAFYQHQTRTGAWTIAVPGSPERSVAQAARARAMPGGAAECLVIANPQDINFQQIAQALHRLLGLWRTDLACDAQAPDHRRPAPLLAVVHRRAVLCRLYLPDRHPGHAARSTAGKFIGKADVSYEYSPSHFIYALWSQGFRRGGANSVPLSGPFQESTRLATYSPDKTNNFEGGFKGHFANGMSYAIDGFYIKWSNPQIASSLPSGNLAVTTAWRPARRASRPK